MEIKQFLSDENYWQFNWVAILIALLLVVFQAVTGKHLSKRKNVLFYSGILLILLVTVTPFAYLAHGYLFSAHMTEHIVLLLIVPPMLLNGIDPELIEKLRKSSFHKTGNFLFTAPVAWILGMGAMYFWHIPSVFSAMKTSWLLHTLHILSLLILGLIFIWPVYAPVHWKKLGPMQSILYLFIACTGCTVLGIMITFAPSSVFIPLMPGRDIATWEIVRNSWGIGASVDQQAGGLIMWVPACIIYISNILVILSAYFRETENETM